MTLLGPNDLARYLEEQAIKAELVPLDVPTPTVESAAQAVGTSPDQILKSLVFLVDDRAVLVIACGPDPIDRRPIAAHFEVGRKRVRLADPEAVAAATGYPVGAVPPFGHPRPLPTFMDRKVLSLTQAYAGGGAIDTLVRVSPQEIARVTRAEIIDLQARTP